MGQRIIAALSVELDGAEVTQGAEVDLTAEQEAWLEGMRGALVPKDFDTFKAYSDFKMDAYRGGRGDVEAAARVAEARSGGIVDLSPVEDGTNAQVRGYITWLQSDAPTVDEVVEAVDGDPAKAQAMLEAEQTVTGGEPRKSVVKHLEAIVGG